MLYKVVLTLESVNGIPKYDHLNESYWAVIFCNTEDYTVQGSSNFWVWIQSQKATIKMKATEQYFPVVLFTICGWDP